MSQTQSTTEHSASAQVSLRQRAGAAGKALLVYLGTGSIGAAIVAFLLFKGMGC